MTNPTHPSGEMAELPKPRWTPIERTNGFAWSEDQMNAHYLAGFEAGRATRPACAHRVVDARNRFVQSGYLCVDCNAIFAAADHGSATRPVAEAESFYVRFAKEWITADSQARQDIRDWVSGWYESEALSAPAESLAAPAESLAAPTIPQAAEVPEFVERTCGTCRHEKLSGDEGACAGCGYAEAYDRWEPAVPTPAAVAAAAPSAVPKMAMKLRAMARAQKKGHIWDEFDRETLEAAADAIATIPAPSAATGEVAQMAARSFARESILIAFNASNQVLDTEDQTKASQLLTDALRAVDAAIEVALATPQPSPAQPQATAGQAKEVDG